MQWELPISESGVYDVVKKKKTKQKEEKNLVSRWIISEGDTFEQETTAAGRDGERTIRGH